MHANNSMPSCTSYKIICAICYLIVLSFITLYVITLAFETVKSVDLPEDDGDLFRFLDFEAVFCLLFLIWKGKS